MKQLRQRLTFANVVSCIALFVALGGVSYAATQLPKNSVGAKQLKRNILHRKRRSFRASAGPDPLSRASMPFPESNSTAGSEPRWHRGLGAPST